ncbi:MAG: hypothetical protein O9301_15955 [Leptospira sp.]|nr:hypothetical protein [Leptospira sp.]
MKALFVLLCSVWCLHRGTLLLELGAHATSRALAVAAVPLGAPRTFPYWGRIELLSYINVGGSSGRNSRAFFMSGDVYILLLVTLAECISIGGISEKILYVTVSTTPISVYYPLTFPNSQEEATLIWRKRSRIAELASLGRDAQSSRSSTG